MLKEVPQDKKGIVKRTHNKTVNISISKLVHPEVLLQQTEVLQKNFIIIVLSAQNVSQSDSCGSQEIGCVQYGPLVRFTVVEVMTILWLSRHLIRVTSLKIYLRASSCQILKQWSYQA